MVQGKRRGGLDEVLTGDEDRWESDVEVGLGLKSMAFEAAAEVDRRSRKLLEEHLSVWEPAR